MFPQFYRPTWGGKGEYMLARVRSALADTLLQQIEPPFLRLRPALPPSATDVFWLFFDGCSRGNPGPGGSGSVLLRVQPQTHAATFVWMAKIFLEAKTTDYKHFCRIYRPYSWTTAGKTQRFSTVACHRGQSTGNQPTPGSSIPSQAAPRRMVPKSASSC